MNSKRYINKILTPYIAPFYDQRTKYYGNAVFMHDGAGYHTLKATI